jgi:hypothetical protein
MAAGGVLAFPGLGWAAEGSTIRAMGPAKAQLIRVIEEQPDDSSYEEILRELAFAAMVERGIADSDAGNTIPNDEMGRRIESWRR